MLRGHWLGLVRGASAMGWGSVTCLIFYRTALLHNESESVAGGLRVHM